VKTAARGTEEGQPMTRNNQGLTLRRDCHPSR